MDVFNENSPRGTTITPLSFGNKGTEAQELGNLPQVTQWVWRLQSLSLTSRHALVLCTFPQRTCSQDSLCFLWLQGLPNPQFKVKTASENHPDRKRFNLLVMLPTSQTLKLPAYPRTPPPTHLANRSTMFPYRDSSGKNHLTSKKIRLQILKEKFYCAAK